MDAGPAPQTSSTPSPFEEDMLVAPKPIVDDARFDVTAMVDLVFMMNIYFLVTWTILAPADIDLAPASKCTAADAESSIIFTITKGPNFYIGDAKGGNALTAGEVDVRVQEATERAVDQDNKTIILIKAEKDVQVRDVMHIGRVATTARHINLMLAVVEKK